MHIQYRFLDCQFISVFHHFFYEQTLISTQDLETMAVLIHFSCLHFRKQYTGAPNSAQNTWTRTGKRTVVLSSILLLWLVQLLKFLRCIIHSSFCRNSCGSSQPVLQIINVCVLQYTERHLSTINTLQGEQIRFFPTPQHQCSRDIILFFDRYS